MTEPMPAQSTGPSPAPALSYATPPPPPPSAIAAVVLSLPGMACWLAFGWIILCGLIPAVAQWSQRVVMAFVGVGLLSKLLVCWGVAVVAAIVSLALYVRQRPKPWYVRLNLVVNVAGLLFTVGVFVLIAVLN